MYADFYQANNGCDWFLETGKIRDVSTPVEPVGY